MIAVYRLIEDLVRNFMRARKINCSGWVDLAITIVSYLAQT